MNLFLIITILVTNVIALTIIYQILKRLPKKEILIFLAASFTIIYILVSVVYWLSGIGVEPSVHAASKNMIIYIFVPVNLIFFVPYIAFQYRKLKDKKGNVNDIANKFSIVVVLLILALIIEFFYFKNIQNNIKDISEKMVTNEVVNEQKIENTISNTTSNVTVNETVNVNTIGNNI